MRKFFISYSFFKLFKFLRISKDLVVILICKFIMLLVGEQLQILKFLSIYFWASFLTRL